MLYVLSITTTTITTTATTTTTTTTTTTATTVLIHKLRKQFPAVSIPVCIRCPVGVGSVLHGRKSLFSESPR